MVLHKDSREWKFWLLSSFVRLKVVREEMVVTNALFTNIKNIQLPTFGEPRSS
jgi:hypothetical protein